MSKRPILYLMVGYPGAGKTTVARVVQELTGATHLSSAEIRRERYGRPNFSVSENLALYNHMNQMVKELIASGNSVIFDTAFNYKKDRERLREIAKHEKADTLVLWIHTPKDIAHERATKNAARQDTRILGDMTTGDFDRLSSKLEAPTAGEKHIIIDGTKVTPEYIKSKLSL